MEPFELSCAGRIRMFLTWALYALAVVVVCQAIAARGLPPVLGWAIALGMGLVVLRWTRELYAWTI
ncbi:MAG: hypothetical protein WB615_15075 [Candidatus Tumulicola sp.]